MLKMLAAYLRAGFACAALVSVAVALSAATITLASPAALDPAPLPIAGSPASPTRSEPPLRALLAGYAERSPTRSHEKTPPERGFRGSG